MESSLERNEESKRCPVCRRFVGELFPLTAEDIQRTKDPDVVVCARCREEFRSAARLEVSYGGLPALRDFLVALAAGTVAAVLLTNLLFIYHAYGFNRQQDLITALVLVGFTGSGQVWAGIRHRYGFTHNLRWAVRTGRVLAGFGILASCLVVVILSLSFSL